MYIVQQKYLSWWCVVVVVERKNYQPNTSARQIPLKFRATRYTLLSALGSLLSALATATNRANSKQWFECISYGKALPSFNRAPRSELSSRPSRPGPARTDTQRVVCAMRDERTNKVPNAIFLNAFESFIYWTDVCGCGWRLRWRCTRVYM